MVSYLVIIRLEFRLHEIDFGCPAGHDMQCFNDSGHKDATGSVHWNEQVNSSFPSQDLISANIFLSGFSNIDWSWTSNDAVPTKQYRS